MSEERLTLLENGPASRESHLRPSASSSTTHQPSAGRASRLRAPAAACLTALLLGISLAVLSQLLSEALAAATGAWSSISQTLRKHKDFTANAHRPDCTNKHFTKRTLILLAEYRAARLLVDRPNSGLRNFELSDIVGAPAPPANSTHPTLYAVLDNSFRLLQIDGRVDDRPGTQNMLLHWPDDKGDDSDFEAIAYSTRSKTFLLVREQVVGQSGRLHSHMLRVNITAGADEPVVTEICDSDFDFHHKNKGFEGAVFAVGLDGVEYLLGLCEGNFCSGGKGTSGQNPGHGRLIVMQHVVRTSGKCVFSRVAEIQLPKSVQFLDYSAITIYQGADGVARDGSMMVAVTSQESAAVWVSSIRPVGSEKGYFELDKGVIYDFPVNDNCEVVYCNVEGVFFLNRRTIVAVSDKMKSRGRQSFRCMSKAESVHMFSIPQLG